MFNIFLGRVYVFISFFFFSSRRRHTRYWRDWSSDVCSSDLLQSEREADYRIVELTGSPSAIGQFHADHLSPVQPPFRRWIWENDRAFLRSSIDRKSVV